MSSVSAGLSLVMAGVLALVFVSSVVAFRGWPGMRNSAAISDVTLPAVPPPVRKNGTAAPQVHQQGLLRLPAKLTPAKRKARRAVERADLARAFVERAPAGARPDTSGVSAGAPARPAQQVPAAAGPAPTAVGAPPIADPVGVQKPVEEVLDPIGGAVDETVDGAAGLLKP